MKLKYLFLSMVFCYNSALAAEDNFIQGLAPSKNTTEALLIINKDLDGKIKPSDSVKDLKSLKAIGELGIDQSSSTQENSIPFAAPNSIILQLEPNTTQEDIERLKEQYDLEIIEAYPNLGQIKAATNLNKFFDPKITDNNSNETIIRGMIDASNAFKLDKNITAATPDFAIGTKSNKPYPSVSNYLDQTSVSDELEDWGIDNIQANQLWVEDRANDGITLGVIDVGFARHNDLIFTGVPNDIDVDDHGNHVSGIACAKHDGVGVKGVLPQCFIAPRSGANYPIVGEGGNVLIFMTRFSQILSSFDSFVDANADDIRVFNLSLGYNWASNFAIDPNKSENELYRQLVRTHGEMLLSTLSAVERSDSLIVSAAGNDGRSLDEPISSKFASPFNWASIVTKERGIANNSLIIEAHDINGQRAVFSNINGDLSCPGVDVLSTVSFGENGEESSEAYGYMSGTSMASPYCASGILLLTLIRPKYTMDEILQCVFDTARISTTGANQMQLKAASEACPKK